MEHIAKLIEASLNELELEPHEVTEVEIERFPFTIWCVGMDGRFVFFDCNPLRSRIYEPYTVVTPYTDEELAAYGIVRDVA